MMMGISDLSIALISDIHLGHGETETKLILNGLYRYLPDNEHTAKLDMIVLAGDVFDRELSFPDTNLIYIRKWIVDLLTLCKKHDIILRVLEGTPSHDWEQSYEFVYLNMLMKLGVDVVYVKSLSIEHINRFNIDILYVPDEWRPEHSQTWLEVIHLLKEHKLERVDFAIMHGAFGHQLVEEAQWTMQMHSAENYLSIVKHHVFIGHVHFYSQFNRILSAGSFDRLTHGQEGEKGHIRYHLKSNGTYDIKFVANTLASVYKTIDLTNLALEERLDHVVEVVELYTLKSHFRLLVSNSEGLSSILGALRKLYPIHIWTSKVEKLKTDGTCKHMFKYTHNSIEQTPITKDSIHSVIGNELKLKYPHFYDLGLKLLDKVLK